MELMKSSSLSSTDPCFPFFIPGPGLRIRFLKVCLSLLWSYFILVAHRQRNYDQWIGVIGENIWTQNWEECFSHHICPTMKQTALWDNNNNNMRLTFIEHIPCARLCGKCFTCIISSTVWLILQRNKLRHRRVKVTCLRSHNYSTSLSPGWGSGW